MGIFDKRVAFKPYEYPDALLFVEALQSSIWNHREFNFTQDINDFNINLSEYERGVVKRALLAISQIEISVKLFWSKLFDHFPKPEFNALGVMLSYNELVHEQSYSELLEILGFNDEFSNILQVPEIQGRVDYLQKYIKGSADNAKQAYTLNIALFSSFIENCSLFSQFFIMKSLNQHKNYFSGVDNVISATMLEEDCFIEGTEVLTPNGWKDFRELKQGDDIYGFRDGKLYHDKVLKYHKKHFRGNLIKTGNSKKYVITTPNHDMIQYHEKQGYYKISAENARWINGTYMPNTLIYEDGVQEELSMQDRLKIAIQADGSLMYWTNKGGDVIKRGKDGGANYKIGITKGRKKERLEWILNALDIDYKKEVKNKNTSGEEHCNYIFSFKPEDNFKNFNWVDLHDKSKKWCESFIEELVKWDGSIVNEKTTLYSSTNKSCIDVAQHVAILAGYRTSIGEREDNRKETYKTCYKLTFFDKDIPLVLSHSMKKENLEYDGNVYCATVLTGGLVVRTNNVVMISGNCHAKVGAWLIGLIKEEYPEWFDEDFEKKMVRACKKAYEAEIKIMEWIMGGKDMDILKRSTIDHFLRDRFNKSMKMVGLEPIFEVDPEEIKKSKWFDLEVKLDKHIDFFSQRSVNYGRDQQSVTSKDLF